MQSKFLIQNIIGYKVFKTQTAAQQLMDVRAKQRLSYSACLFTLNLRVGGLAPRQLTRWAACL